MSKVRVDDTSPGISYSGSWQISSDSRQYSSSSHFTTSSGATATIRFTGNLIRVVCTNPAVPDGVIRAEFVLNGKVDPLVRNSHSNAFYDDQFFFANGLSRTEQHVLVIRNLGTQVPLHIDYIEIEGGNAIVPEQIVGPPPSPQPPPTTPTPQRPTPPPTATATRTVVETSVEVVTSAREPSSSSSRSETESLSEDHSASSSSTTSTSSSRSVRSSGPSTATDASSQSGSVTVTAFQIVTTSVSGVAVVTTIGPGGGNVRPTSQGQSLSIGAIIGIIVGSLFLIGLIGVLVILLIRKRPKNQDRSSMVRQRMARHVTDTPAHNPPRPSAQEVEHGDDVESHSANASSIEPPPRLSLNFMRTLHEKSRPFDGQPLSPVGPDSGSTIPPLTTTTTTAPNAYAPSFRSSYPLSLGPDGAPPAYSSVRLSNAPSST